MSAPKTDAIDAATERSAVRVIEMLGQLAERTRWGCTVALVLVIAALAGVVALVWKAVLS